ncbi:MAG: sulfate reduction electron transfer complex DsrMKJOP subunit DsrJ [Elusimicrobiota bacterium]
MHDAGKILAGLVIFLALLTSPLWYNAASGRSAAPPQPVLPVGETQCVAAKDYMRANHMNMLNEWRDLVVREGQRTHVTPDGRKFEMSLTRGCMKCHTNRQEFCVKCHDYSGVTEYCWDCHVEPERVQ